MAHSFSRSNRMRKHWPSIPASQTAFTADSTALLSSFVAAAGEPFTVLRMMGEFIVSPTPGGAFSAGDTACLGFGIGVTSADAITAGSGSMPDPVAEPDYPWLYWSEVPTLVFDGTVAEGLSLATRVVRFDVRSKRKVAPRQGLAFVGEYVDAVGAPPLTVITGGVRFLIAE